MSQYRVRCGHCNRLQHTSKDKFQCRKCGKRSITEYGIITKLEEQYGIDQRRPMIDTDVQLIQGKIIY